MSYEKDLVVIKVLGRDFDQRWALKRPKGQKLGRQCLQELSHGLIFQWLL
jgi:hypothetical protein